MRVMQTTLVETASLRAAEADIRRLKTKCNNLMESCSLLLHSLEGVAVRQADLELMTMVLRTQDILKKMQRE